MSGKGSVLVTGGAKRIGKVICDVLRERGWNVLVHSRDPQNPLNTELSDVDAAEKLFARALECAPDLCAIVNNASQFSLSEEMAGPEEMRMMFVNARTPLRLGDCLHEHLKKNGARGAVVNIVDSRVLNGDVNTPYERSKFKLLDLSRGRAETCAPEVRVNMVAPGPVLAPADKSNSEPGGDVLLDERPTPRDVAEAVAYLLEAKAVTGQIITVDSGQSLMDAEDADFFTMGNKKILKEN